MGWPWHVGVFDGGIEVGEHGQPGKWEEFEFAKAPAVGAGRGVGFFGGEGVPEVVWGDGFVGEKVASGVDFGGVLQEERLVVGGWCLEDVSPSLCEF